MGSAFISLETSSSTVPISNIPVIILDGISPRVTEELSSIFGSLSSYCPRCIVLFLYCDILKSVLPGGVILPLRGLKNTLWQA